MRMGAGCSVHCSTRGKKEEAMTVIAMSIKDDPIPYFCEAKGAATTWGILKGLFESSNNGRRMLLKSKLMNLRFEEVMTVTGLMKPLKDLLNQLASIGEVIRELG